MSNLSLRHVDYHRVILSPSWLAQVLLIIAGVSHTAFAQTGPGGVSSGTTNLLLWLDGRNVNADGTSPANGAEVVTWYDRSGNGVNVTRNTTGVATMSANGVTFNNRGYLQGSDATFPTGNAPRTVILCASSPGTGVDDVLFFYGTAFNFQSYGVLKIGTSNGVRNYFYGNDLDVTGGFTPSGTLKIITCTYAPNTQLVHINNDATPDSKTTANVNTTLGAQGLQIGGWDSFSLFSEATIAEIIFYDKVLNNAERIIVNNYLSAKYGLTLADNDIYDNDDGTNGNYDHNVAGIGRATGATQTNLEAWSSITKIANPTDLENGEYYMWGHDAGGLVPTTAGIPAGIVERMERIWRGSETGGDNDVGNVDLSFDMTGFGPFDASDLRLLISANNDTDFNDMSDISVSGAVHSGGNIYTFQNVSQLTNDRRFTIGIVNVPLPVELRDFDAEVKEGKVLLTWTTLTEINNDYFTIERSPDGDVWEEVFTIPGSGNSTAASQYHGTDNKPLGGRSYYRLKQTDFDGTTSYSSIEAVDVNKTFGDIRVYPVPATVEVYLQYPHSESSSVKLIDRFGREYPVEAVSTGADEARIDVSSLAPGLYYLCITYGRDTAYRKIIIE